MVAGPQKLGAIDRHVDDDMVVIQGVLGCSIGVQGLSWCGLRWLVAGFTTVVGGDMAVETGGLGATEGVGDWAGVQWIGLGVSAAICEVVVV